MFSFNKFLYIQPIIYVFKGELIFFTCSTIQNFSFRSSKSKDNKLCAEILKWFLGSSRKFFHKNILFRRPKILLRKFFIR